MRPNPSPGRTLCSRSRSRAEANPVGGSGAVTYVKMRPVDYEQQYFNQLASV